MTIRRFTLSSLLAATSILVALRPSPVRADICYGFPNNQCANTANTAVIENIDVSLKVSGFPGQIKTKTAPGGPYTVVAPACSTGTTVATSAANALCEAVIASGISCFTAAGAGAAGTCTAHVAPIAPGGCAAAFAIANVDNVVCDAGGAAGDEFDIRQTGGTIRFAVLPCSANTVDKFQLSRNQGGWTTEDLLDSVLIRVDPDGAPGNVTFNVVGAPGPGPSTFTVSTALGDLAFHQGVRDGFLAAGVAAIVLPPDQIGRFVDPPSTGNFVEVSYLSNVTEFEVRPATVGPNVTVQMDDVFPMPTMSEWGMAILTALLLVTGVWMLRRRRRLQQV